MFKFRCSFCFLFFEQNKMAEVLVGKIDLVDQIYKVLKQCHKLSGKYFGLGKTYQNKVFSDGGCSKAVSFSKACIFKIIVSRFQFKISFLGLNYKYICCAVADDISIVMSKCVFVLCVCICAETYTLEGGREAMHPTSNISELKRST